MKTFFILICCLFLWTGCAPTTANKLESKAGAVALTPEELLNLVDNNTLFMQSFSEDSYLFFAHSGQLFGKDIYNNTDNGQWDVSEDGELCIRMSSWWYGDLLCFQMLKSGSRLHLANSSGVVQYSVKQFHGDSKGLFRQLKKKKKKSYRRSRRAHHTQATAATQQQAGPSSQNEPEAVKNIVDARAPSSSSSDSRELRSTVKWVARDCPGCNLAHANLKKADLVTANLAEANLQGANLRMAQLRRANLEGANLENADLSYANLPGANLKNAHLAGASLKGANLIRADVTGADLTGVDLSGALLEGIRGLNK